MNQSLGNRKKKKPTSIFITSTEEVVFSPLLIGLFVFKQDYENTSQLISMKLYGGEGLTRGRAHHILGVDTGFSFSTFLNIANMVGGGGFTDFQGNNSRILMEKGDWYLWACEIWSSLFEFDYLALAEVFSRPSAILVKQLYLHWCWLTEFLTDKHL